MGPASIKMHDKFGLMIRIETTTYDVSFFRHCRQPEHRNEKLSAPVHDANRTWRGFNLFDAEDLRLFEVLLRGEFNISGFRNRTLRTFLVTPSLAHLAPARS